MCQGGVLYCEADSLDPCSTTACNHRQVRFTTSCVLHKTATTSTNLPLLEIDMVERGTVNAQLAALSQEIVKCMLESIVPGRVEDVLNIFRRSWQSELRQKIEKRLSEAKDLGLHSVLLHTFHIYRPRMTLGIVRMPGTCMGLVMSWS